MEKFQEVPQIIRMHCCECDREFSSIGVPALGEKLLSLCLPILTAGAVDRQFIYIYMARMWILLTLRGRVIQHHCRSLLITISFLLITTLMTTLALYIHSRC